MKIGLKKLYSASDSRRSPTSVLSSIKIRLRHQYQRHEAVASGTIEWQKENKNWNHLNTFFSAWLIEWLIDCLICWYCGFRIGNMLLRCIFSRSASSRCEPKSRSFSIPMREALWRFRIKQTQIGGKTHMYNERVSMVTWFVITTTHSEGDDTLFSLFLCLCFWHFFPASFLLLAFTGSECSSGFTGGLR